MSKLTIIPPTSTGGPVISSEALGVGVTGLPVRTEKSIEATKRDLAAKARKSGGVRSGKEEPEVKREAKTKRSIGSATSSIASMSSVIKENGPFGPIASVLVPVLAASFAVYLYLSAGEGGVAIEGERGKRTLFRWLDVIIGVVVAAAVLSFAR